MTCQAHRSRIECPCPGTCGCREPGGACKLGGLLPTVPIQPITDPRTMTRGEFRSYSFDPDPDGDRIYFLTVAIAGRFDAEVEAAVDSASPHQVGPAHLMQLRTRAFRLADLVVDRGRGVVKSRTGVTFYQPDPKRVKVRAGWMRDGRTHATSNPTGTIVGPDVTDREGQCWTPVLWDDEGDPDFFKAVGLEDA